MARPPPVLITNVFPDSVLESSVLSPIRLGPSDCWQPQTSDLAHRAAGAKEGRERGGPGDPDPWSPLLPSLTPDSFAALAPAPAPVPPPAPAPAPGSALTPVPAQSPPPPQLLPRPRGGRGQAPPHQQLSLRTLCSSEALARVRTIFRVSFMATAQARPAGAPGLLLPGG